MFWHNIQIAIRTTPWVYWVTVVIAPAVVGGVAAYLVMRVLIRLYDRHPRGSVRCRRCYYDLRATAGDTCPECGADLTRGVWREGRPRRLRLALIWALWTAVMIGAGVPMSRVFWEHTYEGEPEPFVMVGPAPPVFITTTDPGAATYVKPPDIDAVYLPIVSSRIVWPWSTALLKVSHWKMWVNDRQRRITIGLKPHSRIPIKSVIVPNSSVPLTDVRLVRILHKHLGTEINKRHRNEAKNVLAILDVLNRVNQIGPAIPSVEVRKLKAKIKLIEDCEVDLGQNFNEPHYTSPIGYLGTMRHIPFFRSAPIWTLIVPASFFTLLWLLGLPLLYLRWRKRELSPWQPRSTDMHTAPIVI